MPFLAMLMKRLGCVPSGSTKLVCALFLVFCSTEVVAMQGTNFSVRGQLTPVRHTILAAGIAGRIDAFPVRVGSKVTEGDVLLEMDCKQLEAQLAVSTAQIQAANSRHSVNQRLATANNISLLEVDLSESALAVARAERQQIISLEKFCKLKAPFSGIVVSKNAQAFQHVQVGQPVLELVDNSELEVEVVVPSTWLAADMINQSFEIIIDETSARYTGKFIRSAGIVDPVSQTVRLIGHLTNRSDALIAGMSGQISLVATP